jgi:hypothetical protein
MIGADEASSSNNLSIARVAQKNVTRMGVELICLLAAVAWLIAALDTVNLVT